MKKKLSHFSIKHTP